jgi:hypothetical protein
MVLFLFVVMMLDIKIEPLREGFIRFLPVGVLVGVVMLAEMLALIGWRKYANVPAPPDPAVEQGLSNTEWLGRVMFTDYILPFEVASDYQFACTAHASGQMTVVVEPEPDSPWARLSWRTRALLRKLA